MRNVLLFLFLLFGSVRQENPPPVLLTVSSVIARFEGSPFETDEWIAELGQLDTATGLHRVLIPLWGANAPAYAAQVSSLQWSPQGKRLALVFIDNQGGEGILLYNPETQIFENILSVDAGFTQLSPVTWSPNIQFLVFSALDSSGRVQVFKMKLPGFEISSVIEGRMPVVSPDSEQIAFVAPDGTLTLLNLVSQETQILFPAGDVMSLAWYEGGLTWAVGGVISSYDIEAHQTVILYEVPAEDVKILSISWSAHSQTMAFVLNLRERTENVSQIVMLVEDEPYVLAERRYAAGTLPEDARLFLSIDFQPPGADLSGGGGGDL